MQRTAIARLGHRLPRRHLERQMKATQDAVSDFADWVTNEAGGIPSETAREALHAAKEGLLEGKEHYLKRADKLLDELRKHNSHTFGNDIPLKHADPNAGDFRDVLDRLQSRIEERLKSMAWSR